MIRIDHRLAQAGAGIVIIICLAGPLARLTWTLLGAPPDQIQAANGQSRLGQPASEPLNLSAIVNLAPFGTAIVADETPIGASGNAGLILTLQGVLQSAEASESQAVIATPDGHQESYFQGDSLPGGSTLLLIEKDHVVVLTSGSEHVLAFPRPAHTDVNVMAILGASADGPATSAPIDSVIGQARKRVAENPKALLNQLGVEATSGGYKIGDEAPAMTRRVGFRPGDIVTRVNGVAVGNVEKDQKLFEDVVASGMARVEMMRDGQLIVLTFPLR